jgi:hypothetical protein
MASNSVAYGLIVYDASKTHGFVTLNLNPDPEKTAS